jgi:adhesin transport system outer membrane protein
LNLVQGRADATAAEQSVAELQRQQALNRLVELTGQSTISQASLQAHSATAPPWPTEVASLTDQALAHHPGMRRAQLQRRLAELTVSERQSELQPDVYIRAERQWGHFAIKNAAPENRVFIGFNSKLGAGLSNFSNLEAATEQLSAAAAEVETQERLVREQVAAELAQAQSFALRHRALDGALASSNTVFQSFGRQFNAGRKSWLDLMTAARELARNTTAPPNSWEAPNRAIGVWLRMAWARAVGLPSSLKRRRRFCSAGKNPGVMELTRTPLGAHSRAKNWVRLRTAALAAE